MNTLVDTLAEIEADSFLRDSASCAGTDTCQHDAIQPLEVEAKRTVDTLRDTDGKALVKTQADKVEEVTADKIGRTLMDVIGALLVCYDVWQNNGRCAG